jgi:DNA-binding CsgD family transcriptional regulator
MLLFQRILRTVRGWFRRRQVTNFTLDVNTIRSLHFIARQEQRSAEEVANQILDEALRDQQRQVGNWARWQLLTPREQEVTALICLNYTTRQIASKLQISPETVKTHVEHVLLKFLVPDRNMLRMTLHDWDFHDWDR